MKMKSILLSAAISAAALGSTSVHAGFLSGDITLDGSFSKLPDIGHSSIVSQLDYLDIGRSANIEAGATGWFASANNATATNIDLTGPIHFSYVLTDSTGGHTFAFLANAISAPVYTSVDCTGGSINICTDKLTFDLSGVVSAADFETTAFTGSWSGIGSCVADTSNKCIADVSGTWSVFLDPPVAAVIPEPGTVGLFGIALALLAFIGRRRKA